MLGFRISVRTEYRPFTAYGGGGGDATAPVLSGADAFSTGATTAEASVDTDEGNGTLYAVAGHISNAPSKAQIKAGQDHTGSAAVWADSQAISSAGTKTFDAITGLTSDRAEYKIYFMHEDAAGNQSDVAASGIFATYATIASVTCTNVIAVDLVTGDVLFEKSPDGTQNIASVTKLMTGVLLMENVDLLSGGLTDTQTVVSSDLSGTSFTGGLQVDDVLSIRDLLKNAYLPSSTSAARAIARKIGQLAYSGDGTTTSEFVTAMNSRASALGMSSTTYNDPGGGGSTSSPRDQALLLRHIYNDPSTYGELITTLGLRDEDLTVTGPNARTLNSVTSNPNSLLCGLIGFKVGNPVSNPRNNAVVYETMDGHKVVLVALNSTDDGTSLGTDIRRLTLRIETDWKWVNDVPRARGPSDAFKFQDLYRANFDKGHLFIHSDGRAHYQDTQRETRVSASGQGVKRLLGLVNETDLTEATNPPVYTEASGQKYLSANGSNQSLSANATGQCRNIGFMTAMMLVDVVDTSAVRHFFRYQTNGGLSRASIELNTTDNLVVGARRLDADSFASGTSSATYGSGQLLVLQNGIGRRTTNAGFMCGTALRSLSALKAARSAARPAIRKILPADSNT